MTTKFVVNENLYYKDYLLVSWTQVLATPWDFVMHICKKVVHMIPTQKNSHMRQAV